MAHLLSIPENVVIQHLLPCLDHNDLLRLRRVSKQTKALADAYLWTPKPGHQGKWELKIDCDEEEQTLQAFLQLGLPPPSRLYIANTEEMMSSERPFFEDEHLEIFMQRYGKYVTKLALDIIFFPFTSAKEICFYESLVNLEELSCKEMITVGGSTQFEKKTINSKGRFLIRPTLKKLTILKLGATDCMDSMWNFINGVSANLEHLMHPFHPRNGEWQWDEDENGEVISQRTNFAPIRQLIERRGMKSQRKLVYDWIHLRSATCSELQKVFASCLDKGIIIKNLRAPFLDCLFCEENDGLFGNRDEVVGPIGQEWKSRVNHHRNLFVGSIIHSLVGLTDNVLVMEMPALENITISKKNVQIYRRAGLEYPQWPNLRKMHVRLSYLSAKHFRSLLSNVMRPKLEELALSFRWNIPYPLDSGMGCGNLKKLTIDCLGGDPFFLMLWDGLPLLEDVTLYRCSLLTNKGFVGNEVDGSRPIFLNLKKLKRLNILALDEMPMITDTVFRKVFRHLKLSRFTLSSDVAIKSITLSGIKELLTGPFAETIERLNLDELKLENVSFSELKEVMSCFRSSKMI